MSGRQHEHQEWQQQWKRHMLMGSLVPAGSSTPLYSPLALTLIFFDWLLAMLLFVS